MPTSYYHFQKAKYQAVNQKGLLREIYFPYLPRKSTHRPKENLQKHFRKCRNMPNVKICAPLKNHHTRVIPI